MRDIMEVFSPDELGLERIVVDGRPYIDVTPLYLDSAKSIEVYKRIDEIRSRREALKRAKNHNEKEKNV